VSGRRAVTSDGAPKALGPYSQAVEAGDFVFCAGQVGLDPATGRLVPGGIAAETTRALENLA
jgi:2-iminobutanoate/2-iminopropanoate deaminase